MFIPKQFGFEYFDLLKPRDIENSTLLFRNSNCQLRSCYYEPVLMLIYGNKIFTKDISDLDRDSIEAMINKLAILTKNTHVS